MLQATGHLAINSSEGAQGLLWVRQVWLLCATGQGLWEGELFYKVTIVSLPQGLSPNWAAFWKGGYFCLVGFSSLQPPWASDPSLVK